MRPVCFKSYLFPSQWGGYTKNKTTNQISRLVWSNLSNCRKMKDKEYHIVNFATFVSKTLIFSPQKMDEFNFKPAQFCINKIFELTKSCICIWIRYIRYLNSSLAKPQRLHKITLSRQRKHFHSSIVLKVTLETAKIIPSTVNNDIKSTLQHTCNCSKF